MLELFSKIDPLELLNSNLNKVEKTEFKDNIIFTSFNADLLSMSEDDISKLTYSELNDLITIKNLSKKEVHDSENDKFEILNNSFDEFINNIKSIDYFSSLYSQLIDLKKENPLDYPNKIYDLLSSDSILRFKISKDDKNYMIDVLSNNAHCIGAAIGQKSWIFGISYGAIKPRKDEIKFLSDKLIFANQYLNESMMKDFNEYHTEKLDIEQIVSKLDELNKNEFFNDIIQEKLDSLIYDSKSTQLYLTDYFGLNNYNHFDIELIQERLLEYYLNNPKTNPKSEKTEGVCRSCSKSSLLIKNNNYSKIFDYSSHTFNLQHLTEGKKSINNSVLFCQECSDKLDDINNMISSEKLHFLKIGVNGFSGSIKKYSNMSEIHTSGYDNIVESVFYKIQSDELSKKANNLVPIIEINAKEQKEKQQMAKNFNLIQNLFGFKLMEEGGKWASNWIDIVYKSKYSKSKKDISIERSIKSRQKILSDFWINNKKVSNNDLNKIIQESLINNKLIEKNGIYYYYNLFSFLTDLSKYKGEEVFETTYLVQNGNKEIKYGVHDSIYDLFTLNEGEENMFERHKRINNEISKLDNSENELSEIELNLSDDDFWVLYGRIVGYLNQKSKSQEQSLDYMNKLKQVTKRNLILILENSFMKYSYDIRENQTKFKLLYSYILESIESKVINDSTFNSILSGSLNSKIIKLTKNIKKD